MIRTFYRLFQRIIRRIGKEMKLFYWKLGNTDSITSYGIEKKIDKEELVSRLINSLGSNIDDIIKRASVEEKSKILSEANKAILHTFDYLGSGPTKIEPLKWNIDYKTNYAWPQPLFFNDILHLQTLGNDIKFPWEMSRCHHLLWLGEAYILTNEEHYAKEVIFQLEHWIENNPIMYTVNWTCSMDVAIRAVNWMYSILMISKSTYFDDVFAKKIYKSIYQHGYYIKHNLEKNYPYSNNHYFSNLTGLLFIGSIICNKKGKYWFNFAREEYFKETLVQVFPSGVNYERSVSYHRLMTEFVVFSYGLLLRKKIVIPNEILMRVNGMLDYISHYTMQNGDSPLIADNDNGRFLPFVKREFRTHGYLTNESSLELRLLAIDNDFRYIPVEKLCSICYLESNQAILRNKDLFSFITLASRWKFDDEKVKTTGTHLHNDLLSFTLAYKDKEIISDAGSYCYTSDPLMCYEFHSTSKHNTVVVDKEEQNLLFKNKPFFMKYNSLSKPLVFDKQNNSCIGEYMTIEGNLMHKREFILDEFTYTIIDSLKKSGENHEAVLYFHCATDVIPEIVNNQIYLKANDFKIIMNVESDDLYILNVADDTISPSFGVLNYIKTISISFKFNECSTIKTSFIIV